MLLYENDIFYTPGLFSDTHGLLDRSQTVSDKAREPIISKIDHLSVPKTLISREGEEEKSYKRWKTGAVKIGGDDFVSDFIHADQRCFRTFREKFPELESYICEIRLSLKLVFNYFSDDNYTKEESELIEGKTVVFLRNHSVITQFKKGRDLWKSISPCITDQIKIKGDEVEGDTETLTQKKARIDRMFKDAID